MGRAGRAGRRKPRRDSSLAPRKSPPKDATQSPRFARRTRVAMFELEPSRSDEKAVNAVKDSVLSILNAIVRFLSAGFVWRGSCILLGGGLIFFAARAMMHGHFTFYNPRKATWESAPGGALLGLFLIYMGLRKKAPLERDHESDSAPPAPHEDEEKSSHSGN